MYYYKFTRKNGFDHYTGKTINYRRNIGKIVKVPNSRFLEPRLCTDSVLHASKDILWAAYYTTINSSVFIVKGNPIVSDKRKSGFKKMFIVKELDSSKMKMAQIMLLRKILIDKKPIIRSIQDKRIDKIYDKILLMLQQYKKYEMVTYENLYDDRSTLAKMKHTSVKKAKIIKTLDVILYTIQTDVIHNTAVSISVLSRMSKNKIKAINRYSKLLLAYMK